jgi:hypothetical protein
MPINTVIMIVVVILFVGGYLFFMRKRLGGGGASGGLGGQQAKQIRSDLKRGDVSSLQALLQETRGQDWDAHTFYCDVLARSAPDHLLQSWCEQAADQALPFLVRGRASIERAWDARGGGSAGQVTDESLRRFKSLLQAAERDLLQAAQADPANPAPYAFLLKVANGLSQGREQASEYFDATIQRDPENFEAHVNMLTVLCEKWQGSHDLMFDFARSRAAAASEGSDLRLLPVLAHIERWLYFSFFDEDDKAANAYLKDSKVLEECLAAYGQSLASPNLRPRSSTVLARNIAAFWFFLAKDKRKLQAEIAQIGNAFSEHPWRYWDTPAKAYAEASQWAF